MRALIYGAGNIGRGFIAQLTAASGYEVCFIDTAAPLIEALNREGRYPVRLLSPENSRDVWVEGVRALNGADREKTAAAITEADIMATAVGVRNLPLIAPVIAGGLRQRFARAEKPLNIIICENLIDSRALLEKHIKEYLSPEEQSLFDKRIGLVEASIGRMVPVQTAEMRDGNALRICTEDYGLLPVDRNAFKGALPPIKGMEAFPNFRFIIERKLFIHNMGHAAAAYLGMYTGRAYIHETVRQGEILFITQNAMTESALALSKKHGAPPADLHAHIRDLIRRFGNRALGDTCARVGADTARKLGAGDRLAGAIRCCGDGALNPAFICIGAAAALYRHLEETNSPQSRKSAAEALALLSGLPENSAGAELVLSMYSRLNSRPPEKALAEMIQAALTVPLCGPFPAG